MKSVWKTPEFWAVLIGNGVSLVVLFGGISGQQGTELTSALQTITGGVLSVLTIFGFITAQGKRKIAAASLMMARLQGTGGDPMLTMSSAVDAEAKALLDQL